MFGTDDLRESDCRKNQFFVLAKIVFFFTKKVQHSSKIKKMAKNIIILNENRHKSMVDSGRTKNIPKCQVPEEHNGRLWLKKFEGFSPIQSMR